MRTDTRAILVDQDGLRIAKLAAQGGARLCHFCAVSKTGCKQAIYPEAERCGQFVPPLILVPPMIGLDGPFSTFRASSIWFDRAKAIMRGSGVFAMVDSKTQTIFGHARIMGAHRGRAVDMLNEYAWTNHLCKDMGLTKAEAATWLRKWIRNQLGQRYIKSDDQISTVIEFEPLQRKQAAN